MRRRVAPGLAPQVTEPAPAVIEGCLGHYFAVCASTTLLLEEGAGRLLNPFDFLFYSNQGGKDHSLATDDLLRGSGVVGKTAWNSAPLPIAEREEEEWTNAPTTMPWRIFPNLGSRMNCMLFSDISIENSRRRILGGRTHENSICRF